MQRLCSHWAEQYDWRRLESVLNGHGQSLVTVDELDVHFLHICSGVAGARPLMLLHGWPGGVVEYLGVIASLTGSTSAGQAAFDLVIPSLPGFGFSGRPRGPGWGVDRIASAMAELMHRLGYDHYLLQGGDWGSVIATAIAAAPNTRCRGVHLTTLTIAPPDRVLDTDRVEAEQIAARRGRREQFAYAQLQATRPQTLGYALADSPTGQAAWIYEKLVAWTDHDGDARTVVPDDTALDIISMYWFGTPPLRRHAFTRRASARLTTHVPSPSRAE